MQTESTLTITLEHLERAEADRAERLKTHATHEICRCVLAHAVMDKYGVPCNPGFSSVWLDGHSSIVKIQAKASAKACYQLVKTFDKCEDCRPLLPLTLDIIELHI